MENNDGKGSENNRDGKNMSELGILEAELLGKKGNAEGAERLMKALEETKGLPVAVLENAGISKWDLRPVIDFRKAAVKALGEIGDPRAVELLQVLLEGEMECWKRAGDSKGTSRYGHSGKYCHNILRSLILFWNEEQAMEEMLKILEVTKELPVEVLPVVDFRIAALEALGKMGGSRAVKLLVLLLEGEMEHWKGTDDDLYYSREFCQAIVDTLDTLAGKEESDKLVKSIMRKNHERVVDYNGVKLELWDAAVLVALEALQGRKLTVVDNIDDIEDSDEPCIQVDNFKITRMRLTGDIVSVHFWSLPESFGKLVNLKELDLSNNGLSSLPKSFGKLVNLEKLVMESNILISIPKWLGKLTNLISLDLCYNQLSSLPEWIGKLTKLEELVLVDNQLSSLPESIGELVNLEQLYLSDNQLSSLPEWISKLTKLGELGLRGNQLSDLPEWIGKLENLKDLGLHGNQLSSLPESFSKLVKLEVLQLRNNQFTSLPESFGKLVNLKQLYLSGNQLSSLPESFGKLVKLEWLHLNNNQLSALPESIGKLANLKNLNLNDNPLDRRSKKIAKSLKPLEITEEERRRYPVIFSPEKKKKKRKKILSIITQRWKTI